MKVQAAAPWKKKENLSRRNKNILRLTMPKNQENKNNDKNEAKRIAG